MQLIDWRCCSPHTSLRWQSAYGDLDFDRKKFPDPGAMVARLHDLGFKVTLWVMPFIEEASEAYKEGAAKGFLVQSDRKRWFLKPGFFHWCECECLVLC